MIKEEKPEELKQETIKRKRRLNSEMKAMDDFKLTVFDNTEGYDQMIIMDNVKAVAKCEHHECEFHCIVSAGYIPKDKLMGASKFVRIIRKSLNLGKKTLQERATQEILDSFLKLKCQGAMVVVKGKHSCIGYRGVHSDSTMITSAVAGAFRDNPATRAEFISYTSEK